MKSILIIVASAAIVNNFVFKQVLGICPFLGISDKVETSLGMGAAVTFVMAMASAVTWALQKFVLNRFGLQYLQTIMFILVIATLVQLVEMFIKKSSPTLYQALGVFLPLITTNCAVLGVALINIKSEYTLIESVFNGVGAALGFTLAIVLLAGIRERLDESDVSPVYKGLPIALVVAGILAMAFSGFQGVL
ncbi:electron transport complex protein RnfA [Clostridium sp. 'deep sea']|uniref:electron transport complex protein RnfA n=1 Tax=Clostridium sp. 'deep sea' TaxID=2779445 RepID=UPI002434165B|nr:electron transport complex protein RnfA [Clostridium sp. 'deep sea']